MKDFNETFAEELTDPDFAAAYLEAAREEGPEALQLARDDVARASGVRAISAEKRPAAEAAG